MNSPSIWRIVKTELDAFQMYNIELLHDMNNSAFCMVSKIQFLTVLQIMLNFILQVPIINMSGCKTLRESVIIVSHEQDQSTQHI